MSPLVLRTVEYLVLPPGGPLLVLLLAILLYGWGRFLAFVLLLVGALSLYAASTPKLAHHLMARLEGGLAPLRTAPEGAQAIVVPGAGHHDGLGALRCRAQRRQPPLQAGHQMMSKLRCAGRIQAQRPHQEQHKRQEPAPAVQQDGQQQDQQRPAGRQHQVFDGPEDEGRHQATPRACRSA